MFSFKVDVGWNGLTVVLFKLKVVYILSKDGKFLSKSKVLFCCTNSKGAALSLNLIG